MKNPRAEAEITEQGIKVTLHNWDGVSNVMIERMHYAIVKQAQVWRAEQLGKLHGEKMKAEAEARKEASGQDTPEKAGTGIGNFLKELSNAIIK